MSAPFEFGELVKRAIKYIVEGVIVAICAFAIPKHAKLAIEEVFIIGLSAAATFAILDTFAPSIGSSARQGTGMGIGFNLAGFPRPM